MATTTYLLLALKPSGDGLRPVTERLAHFMSREAAEGLAARLNAKAKADQAAMGFATENPRQRELWAAVTASLYDYQVLPLTVAA